MISFSIIIAEMGSTLLLFFLQFIYLLFPSQLIPDPPPAVAISILISNTIKKYSTPVDNKNILDFKIDSPFLFWNKAEFSLPLV